jgi:hypothetical protein
MAPNVRGADRLNLRITAMTKSSIQLSEMTSPPGYPIEYTEHIAYVAVMLNGGDNFIVEPPQFKTSPKGGFHRGLALLVKRLIHNYAACEVHISENLRQGCIPVVGSPLENTEEDDSASSNSDTRMPVVKSSMV